MFVGSFVNEQIQQTRCLDMTQLAYLQNGSLK